MQTRAHHFLFLLPLLLSGCSAKVEVSTEKRTPSQTTGCVERTHTKVGVAVLPKQEDPGPAPVPEESDPEQPPTPPEADKKAVEITGNANLTVLFEGDLHLHQHYHEHLHVEEPLPAAKGSEETPNPVKVEAPRPERDPRCERLLREHIERVEVWKAMVGR